MSSIDLDAWYRGEISVDIGDPDVVVELRRVWWREEAREFAQAHGLATDDEFLDRLSQDLRLGTAA